MDLYSSISQFVADTKAKLAEAKSDGKVTVSEIVVLFMDAGERLVKAASLMDIAGADKKAAVLEALGTFYDTVIAPLDIPGIPNLIEGTVDIALRSVLLKGADYFIEYFVSKLGK
jgi:hypothetical protein